MKDSSDNSTTIEHLQAELQHARDTISQLEGKVEMYQRVIDHLPHYYTFWKDLKFRFLGGDKRFYQKGGYDSMEDMIGKTDYDSAWATREADGFRNIDEMVVYQNLPEYTVIEQQTPADGEAVWLSTTKVAMTDDEGNVIGLVGVSDDVTEKLKREKLLKESENRFRQLSEASSEGVAIYKSARITDTNLFLADMFNYEASELIGMPLVDLLASEFQATFEEHLESNNTLPFRAIGLKYNPFSRLDGQVRFDVEITLRNDPIQAISFRDISEQIKVEKIKDDFLANTSHELRTPLNGIIGVSESLIAGVAGTLPDKVKSNLLMIISSSRRLYNLVNDILDYSKMKNESLELLKKPVNLKIITDLILTLTRPLVVDKQLLLINEIPDDLPAVLADEDRVQQILYNLIGNAIKFTAQGEIKVQTKVEGERIKISVSDTGIGIPNSRQKAIFKSFQQADSSTRRNYGGSGLGLAISRQLVQLHGSHLRVDSIPEKGSTFHFYLDICDSSARNVVCTGHVPALTSLAAIEPVIDEHRSLDSVPEAFDPQGEGQKILVVDDEPINLQMMKNFLQLHEYNVMSAQSGFQALEILKSDQPDLVILDIMMPRMDGYELCGLIRESFDAWQLPILFLTAKNQISDRVKGLSRGANDFITKPFYQEELLIRVNTHLRVKESFETIRENQQLKIEIHKHKQSELELESSSRRICGILDIYDNALIAVNENMEVVYLNRRAGSILGSPRDRFLNSPVKNLLAEEFVSKFENVIHEIDKNIGEIPDCKMHFALQLLTESGQQIVLNTVLTTFEVDDECIYTFTADEEPLSSESGAGKDQDSLKTAPRQIFNDLIKEQLVKTEAVSFFEGIITNVIDRITSADYGDISNVNSKTEISRGTSEIIFYQRQEFRAALVELMHLSVDCWKESTGKSKWQLADESGLWNAYLDQGVYKTRTMNKYLKTTTLPKNPKWNRVLDTAEFVLVNHSGLRSENIKKLVRDQAQLIKTINSNIKSSP